MRIFRILPISVRQVTILRWLRPASFELSQRPTTPVQMPILLSLSLFLSFVHALHFCVVPSASVCPLSVARSRILSLPGRPWPDNLPSTLSQGPWGQIRTLLVPSIRVRVNRVSQTIIVQELSVQALSSYGDDDSSNKTNSSDDINEPTAHWDGCAVKRRKTEFMPRTYLAEMPVGKSSCSERTTPLEVAVFGRDPIRKSFF